MFHHIRWVSIPVFESMAEAFGVDVHFLRQEQAREQGLPLQEHVVFRCVFLVVWISDAEDVIAEGGNHEQRLVQTIHVTDAAQVFYAYVTCCGFLVFKQLDVPVCILVGPPRSIGAEAVQVSQDCLQVFEAISAKNVKQIERIFSRFWVFTFGGALTIGLRAVRDLEKAFVDQVACHNFAAIELDLGVQLQ